MKNLLFQMDFKQCEKAWFGFLFLLATIFCSIPGHAQKQKMFPNSADSTYKVAIEGYIMGEKTNDIMAGATILFNDKAYGITDEVGHYLIRIPDSLLKSRNILKVRLIGYLPIKDTLKIKTSTLQKDYILHRDSTSMDPNKLICTISREEWMKDRYSANK